MSAETLSDIRRFAAEDCNAEEIALFLHLRESDVRIAIYRDRVAGADA